MIHAKSGTVPAMEAGARRMPEPITLPTAIGDAEGHAENLEQVAAAPALPRRRSCHWVPLFVNAPRSSVAATRPV